MLSTEERGTLVTACRLLEPGPDYRDNDYITWLFTTVLDFQMLVETFWKAQAYYRELHWDTIRNHGDLVGFLGSHEDTKAGNTRAAQALWGNNHWTRMSFLRVLVKFMEQQGVGDLESAQKWAASADFKCAVRGQVRSEHHSVGLAIFKWMQLRLGVPAVKPDVWVLRFVQGYIGRWPTEHEAAEALESIAVELAVPAHRLDAAIWHQMRGR